jgi:CheY-like chemotaxis protein
MNTETSSQESDLAERRLVLVVEDDRDIRESIQAILEEEGLLVETAASGLEALQKANEHRPALVLLDLTLPDLEGERVSEMLQMIGGGDVPVLVITGHSWAAERAVRVGAVDYLRKPFELDDLVQAVDRILGKSR